MLVQHDHDLKPNRILHSLPFVLSYYLSPQQLFVFFFYLEKSLIKALPPPYFT